MLVLHYAAGSPFARGVRIVLNELALDYKHSEDFGTLGLEEKASTTPTLEVPCLQDGNLTLWESGLIVDYLLSNHAQRPDRPVPLAPSICRAEQLWQDQLTFATIQTFGRAATTISQLTWTGIGARDNGHLARSAEKLTHILAWSEQRLTGKDQGFWPGVLSVQDIFLAAHLRFVQARPLGIELHLENHPKISALLKRLDERASFKANPIWWWEPGVTGYQPDGTPIYGN